ncbi:MAG: helix-turn-helix transcriptional regulator [Planctomycetes bacterium]|nr:helix-turn-helix transcriptional regulator [Planctomycetota bacterium]
MQAKAVSYRGGSGKCAHDFGVSPQQWSPWERGTRTPDGLRLTQIADFFHITVDDLLRDDRKNAEGESASAQHDREQDGGAFRFVGPDAAVRFGMRGGGGMGNKNTVSVPVFV